MEVDGQSRHYSSQPGRREFSGGHRSDALYQSTPERSIRDAVKSTAEIRMLVSRTTRIIAPEVADDYAVPFAQH